MTARPVASISCAAEYCARNSAVGRATMRPPGRRARHLDQAELAQVRAALRPPEAAGTMQSWEAWVISKSTVVILTTIHSIQYPRGVRQLLLACASPALPMSWVLLFANRKQVDQQDTGRQDDRRHRPDHDSDGQQRTVW